MKKWHEIVITVLGVLGLYGLIQYLVHAGIIDPYSQGVLTFIGIYIVAAASLNLVTGFLGELALGHAGFIAIGAYGSAIFSKEFLFKNIPHINPTIALVISLLIGGLIAGIFGLLIGIPALRLRGDYLGIVTLGFGEIIRSAINNLETITGGARGYRGIKNLVGLNEIFWIVVIVLTVLFLLIRSRHGRAIISIKENQIAAESIGIPTTFYKIFAFATSAFFAGVAGGAMAFKMRMIDPKKFTFMFSVEIFVYVVLGGMGSLTGTVIAALVLGILNQYLVFMDQWRLVIYSIFLIVMMIFRPKGLFGNKEFSLAGLVRWIIKKLKKPQQEVAK